MKKPLPVLITALLTASAALATASTVTSEHSPGGVDGTVGWFVTVPVSGGTTSAYRWADLSGDSLRLLSRRNGVAEFRTPYTRRVYLNFNPCLRFDGTTPLNTIAFPHADLRQSTVVGVYGVIGAMPGTTAPESMLYSISGAGGVSTAVTDRRIVAGTGLAQTINFGYDGLPRVLTTFHASAPQTSVWAPVSSTMTFGSAYSTDSAAYFGGIPATGLPTRHESTLAIPEAIVYNRLLTPGERARVETYLAMKYGVTRSGSYISPDGTLIWDSESNAAYHNNIAAVARFDTEHLDQHQSQASYDGLSGGAWDTENYFGGQPTAKAGVRSLLVMGSEPEPGFPDGGYLLWGDDAVNPLLIGAGEESEWDVLSRTWKAESSESDIRYYAELNHRLADGGDFLRHCPGMPEMLIADRDTEFGQEGTKRVKCSGIDLARGRLTFGNIDFRDTGERYFTFGHKNGLDTDFEVQRTTCDGDRAGHDGTLTIRVIHGIPPYRWSLKAETVEGMTQGVTVSEGTFTTAAHAIDRLSAGVYHLDISQGGGSGIWAYSPENGVATHSRYGGESSPASVSWTVDNLQSHYTVCLLPSSAKTASGYPGFTVAGDVCTPEGTGNSNVIRRGTVLGLEISGSQILHTIDGVTVHRSAIPSGRLEILAVFKAGSSHIGGLTAEGSGTGHWSQEGEVYIAPVKEYTQSHLVYIGDCNTSTRNEVTRLHRGDPGEQRSLKRTASGDMMSAGTDASFTVIRLSGTHGDYSARLIREDSSPATLMVFDSAGLLIAEREMESDSGDCRAMTASFTLDTPGVYIVKAFTHQGEHTCKLIKD